MRYETSCNRKEIFIGSNADEYCVESVRNNLFLVLDRVEHINSLSFLASVMVNDFDAQAANQIPKIIANETVDEVELVRQNNSGLSGICSRVTLAVVKAEKAWPLLRQVSAMSKSLADRLLICQPALARRTRAAGNDVRQGRYWSWFEELFIELF